MYITQGKKVNVNLAEATILDAVFTKPVDNESNTILRSCKYEID